MANSSPSTASMTRTTEGVPPSSVLEGSRVAEHRADVIDGVVVDQHRFPNGLRRRDVGPDVVYELQQSLRVRGRRRGQEHAAGLPVGGHYARSGRPSQIGKSVRLADDYSVRLLAESAAGDDRAAPLAEEKQGLALDQQGRQDLHERLVAEAGNDDDDELGALDRRRDVRGDAHGLERAAVPARANLYAAVGRDRLEVARERGQVGEDRLPTTPGEVGGDG
jgi:hypothetical protein